MKKTNLILSALAIVALAAGCKEEPAPNPYATDAYQGVVINKISAHDDQKDVETWIELANTSSKDIDLSNLNIFLSDEFFDGRALADLTGKTLILADTMLATGASLEIAYKRLCEEGEPFHTHLVCPVSSAYAVEYLQKHLPEKGVTLWVAAIDEELTSHSYIVPGLGDAGDLAYGVKK